MKKVFAAVVGGGAAGLYAANALARAGAACVLLEKQPRVGRKLLSTGNGRCNLTNLNASPEDYFGDAAAAGRALAALPPEAAVAFFASLGVPCVPDEAGRVYPMSNQAAGVLDALRLGCEEAGCEIATEFEVVRIERAGDGFTLMAGDGRSVRAENVLLACGGLAAPKLGASGDGYALLKNFGHRIAPRFAGLAPLKTEMNLVRALKGIRAEARLTLTADGRALRTTEGELLFGEGTVSGIAAMQLARSANEALNARRKCALRINFLPKCADGAAFVRDRAALLPKRALEDFLCGALPKRLAQVLEKAVGLAPLTRAAETLTGAEMRALGDCLTGWTLPVPATQGFDQAQVTAGGAEIGDFDPETLESRLVPGLYAAGELLNVDGDCGGFNLQWAWASAQMAVNGMLARR